MEGPDGSVRTALPGAHQIGPGRTGQGADEAGGGGQGQGASGSRSPRALFRGRDVVGRGAVRQPAEARCRTEGSGGEIEPGASRAGEAGSRAETVAGFGGERADANCPTVGDRVAGVQRERGGEDAGAVDGGRWRGAEDAGGHGGDQWNGAGHDQDAVETVRRQPGGCGGAVGQAAVGAAGEAIDDAGGAAGGGEFCERESGVVRGAGTGWEREGAAGGVHQRRHPRGTESDERSDVEGEVAGGEGDVAGECA
ncbi:hypothetical protein BME24068_06743 [Burkholderia metallica]|nr:hypothetical protein BME24068_06743 [Burkholderia metallica]